MLKEPQQKGNIDLSKKTCVNIIVVIGNTDTIM